tara:strand:- start:1648 stop:1806 length:159 start_codon:yes stop_codon:yes gene_type:complete
MPWLEIILAIIAVLVAFLTGLSSSPIYSKKDKDAKSSVNVKGKGKLNELRKD